MNTNDTAPILRKIRCGIYTRKSSEEGLELEFNSLDAQREAAEAYIQSQRHEGWVALPTAYNDGGYSGGNMERPGLQKLLKDIENGKIDCVVVYKVDRLSRSLLDFSKIIEVFDRHEVSFVAVTQSFCTTTSMGRLTLNILLSFAQFEREIIGERIRDKIAASKKKGKYTGGLPPFGYDIDTLNHRLVVNETESKVAQWIFKRYAEVGSPIQIARELNQKGIRTKSWTTRKGILRAGKSWTKSHISRVLNNPVCIGQITHKEDWYPGEQPAILSKDLWDRVHSIMETNAAYRVRHVRTETPSLLGGIIRCGHCDSAMSPISTRKGSRRYRYYRCGHSTRSGRGACPIHAVSAGDVEQAVLNQLRAIFRSPEMVAQTYLAGKKIEVREISRLEEEKETLCGQVRELEETVRKLMGSGITDPAIRKEWEQANRGYLEAQHRLEETDADLSTLKKTIMTEQEVAETLGRLDPVWEELFPQEQIRIFQLLVEKVIVYPEELDISIRTEGLHSLIAELKNTVEFVEERKIKP